MSQANFSPVTHVIFDVDGLLLDSVELYQSCHNKVLKPLGFSLSYEEIMALMGRKAIEVAENICARLRLPFTAEEYKQRVSHFYPQVFPSVKIMSGAEKLIRHLHSHAVPMALASGGSQENFDLKTTNHRELFSVFLHSVFASSDPAVSIGKPSPEVFQVCAARFEDKPEPPKCLVFEDAPNGVAASLAAQMQVVMVPDARLDREQTKCATLVINSLEDFNPELFGLPPYK